MKRQFLHEEIKNRSLTYTSVGEAVNVTRQMISHIVNCRHNPSWKLQQRLVQYFGISAEKLLAITNTNLNQHSNTISNDKQFPVT